jgi:nucleotide-binding universal stress UspA family protein
MPKTLQHILIGTTLAEGSDEVVQAGFGLAAASGAVAHLVHATPPSPAREPDSQRLFESLTEQAYRAGLDGIHFELHVERGLPHRILERLTDELRADLVVLGASEPAHPRPFGLGSTVDRFLRQATCPVLVVRPSLPFPPQRILIPVDFSAGATGAFRYGMKLLRELEGQMPDTELLFVLSPGENSIHFSAEQIARFAVDELHRFVSHNLPDGAQKVERKVRAGHTAEQVLAEIADRKPDLVILGPQGRSGLEHLIIGSVADKIMHESPASILVVPPEAVRFEVDVESRMDADWRYVSDVDVMDEEEALVG